MNNSRIDPELEVYLKLRNYLLVSIDAIIDWRVWDRFTRTERDHLIEKFYIYEIYFAPFRTRN
jgi:hypothetical protein